MFILPIFYFIIGNHPLQKSVKITIGYVFPSGAENVIVLLQVVG